MNERSTVLLRMRPVITKAKVNEFMSEEEQFQNGVLRPIVKFQNPLLLNVFRNYIAKYKNAYFELSREKRVQYIERAVRKDIKFRNYLRGIIIGYFTLEEHARYSKNTSALNKRMTNLIAERLKDQAQFFDKIDAT